MYNRRIHIIQQKAGRPTSRKTKTLPAPLAAAPLLLKTKKAEAEEIRENKTETAVRHEQKSFGKTDALSTGAIVLLGSAAIYLAWRFLTRRKIKKIEPTPLVHEPVGEKEFEMMRDMHRLETVFFDVTGPREAVSSEKELYRRRLVNALTEKLSDIPYDDYQDIMTVISKHLSVGELMEIMLSKKVTYALEPEDKRQIMEIMDKYLTEDDRKQILKLIYKYNRARGTDYTLH